MKVFRKPDLNAPRFRPKKLNVLNTGFYNHLLKVHPELSMYKYSVVKSVIMQFNGLLRQTVIDHRDGVELMQQLGKIFIGSCPRKKSQNTDYATSAELGVQVQHQNFESDRYTAKIFYTNYENKYSFKYHDLWGFEAQKEFRCAVGQSYPELYKRYIVVDNLQKVSRLFRTAKGREYYKKKSLEGLDNYDELAME